MDGLPIISQLKSLVQVIGGDPEGALQTQENFSKRCPIVSQARSAVEAIAGDTEAAEKTQMEFVHGVSGFVDGIPAVGHVKGVIHYAAGDTDGGDQAMKSASRTTGAMAGGIGGFFVAGPPGAVAGGIAGATAMDGITTGIDSAVHNEYRPAGYVAQVTDIIDRPNDPGQYFDLVGTVVFDGMTGKSAGDLVANKIPNAKKSQAMEKKIGREGTKNVVKSADNVRNQLKTGELPADKSSTQTMVLDKKTGDHHYGENRMSRQNKHVASKPEGTSAKQAIKDFRSAEREAPNSALQRRVKPDIAGKEASSHRGCAEHPAYDGFYKREGAQPAESSASTVRYLPKDKRIVAQERCGRCVGYSDAMGNVPTDAVHDMTVPNKYVSRGQLAASAGTTAALAGGSSTAHHQPSSVAKVTIHDTTETSATVKWSEAIGDKTEYQITVTPSSGVTVKPSQVIGSKTKRKIKLSGLKPGCSYEVSIVTKNGNRVSRPTTVKFTTKGRRKDKGA